MISSSISSPTVSRNRAIKRLLFVVNDRLANVKNVTVCDLIDIGHLNGKTHLPIQQRSPVRGSYKMLHIGKEEQNDKCCNDEVWCNYCIDNYRGYAQQRIPDEMFDGRRQFLNNHNNRLYTTAFSNIYIFFHLCLASCYHVKLNHYLWGLLSSLQRPMCPCVKLGFFWCMGASSARCTS